MLYLNEYSFHSLSFKHYTYQGNLSFEPHFHADFEVIYLNSGEYTVTIDGCTQCVQPGNFVLIFPNQVHSCRCTEKIHIWFADFSPDLVNAFASDMQNMKGADFAFSGADTIAEAMVRRYITDLPEYEQNHLVHAEEIECKYETQALLYAICAEYAKQVEIVSNKSPSDDLISRVAQYIQNHFREDITLTQTAADLNYDPYHLSRLFNRVFQMNFRQYINSCRISYAKLLMNETKSSITSIAYECGYQSIRTFNHAFYSLNGVSPSKYRNQTVQPPARSSEQINQAWSRRDEVQNAHQ